MIPRNPAYPSAAFLFNGQACCQAVAVRSATGVWFDAVELILLKFDCFLATAFAQRDQARLILASAYTTE